MSTPIDQLKKKKKPFHLAPIISNERAVSAIAITSLALSAIALTNTLRFDNLKAKTNTHVTARKFHNELVKVIRKQECQYRTLISYYKSHNETELHQHYSEMYKTISSLNRDRAQDSLRFRDNRINELENSYWAFETEFSLLISIPVFDLDSYVSPINYAVTADGLPLDTALKIKSLCQK